MTNSLLSRASGLAILILVCTFAGPAEAAWRWHELRWQPQGSIAPDGYDVHLQTAASGWASIDIGFVEIGPDGTARYELPVVNEEIYDAAVSAYVWDGDQKLSSPLSNVVSIEAVSDPDPDPDPGPGPQPECYTNADCGDGDVCNGAERCDAGVCRSGSSLTCADPGPCQAAVCDAELGCLVVDDPDDPTCHPDPDPDPGPGPEPEPGVDPYVSVDLDGNGEQLGTNGATTLGIGTEFSLSMWVKPSSLAGERYLFDAVPAEGSHLNSRISIWVRGHGGSPLRIVTWKDDGSLLQVRDFHEREEVGRWMHLVVTQNASGRMEVYLDGVLAQADFVHTDGRGAMADRAREIAIGSKYTRTEGFWNGAIGQVALWAHALGAGEVAEIHAAGHAIDLRADTGLYGSSASLRHYWRLGSTAGALGRDDAGVADLEGIGVDAGNVIADAPLPASGPPPGVAGLALDLDGSGEQLGTAAPATLGIGTEFSLSMWVNPASLSGERYLFDAFPAGSSHLPSRIAIWVRGKGGSPLRIVTWKDDGSLLQARDYFDREQVGRWMHLLVTQADSGRMEVYLDGVLASADHVHTDGRGAMADRPREVVIGAHYTRLQRFWDGLIGHVALWDRALGAAEAAEVAAGGHEIDLRQNTGAYASASRLRHYWRPGEDPSRPGRDFVGGARVHLDQTVGLDASDVVPNAP